VLAIAAGVGLGFLFENYIGGFVSTDQLAAVTHHGVITVLPRQRLHSGSHTLADNLVTHPLSRYAEGVRRLRASIDRLLSTRQRLADKSRIKKGVVVLVSSALPNEGKTTLALSLARSYALAGHRVVIVDCDLRKPTVHKHLSVEPSTGFVDYLTGKLPQEKLASIVVRDTKTSLTAIVGARNADTPTDQLLSTDAFARLISAVCNRFDIVILDSPPIGPVVDGLYLAEHADLVTFVVQWAKTPQRMVVDALRSLHAAKAPSAEIVMAMNQDAGGEGSYRSDYSSYHSD
jgi:succinoglycan biosynthesis transport protein ExoP